MDLHRMALQNVVSGLLHVIQQAVAHHLHDDHFGLFCHYHANEPQNVLMLKVSEIWEIAEK